MFRLLTFFVLLPSALFAQPPLPPAVDPASACVRIQSHGASGTIIATRPGKSYILGCAHMFEDRNGNPSADLRSRKLILDGPVQPHAPKKLAAVRLLAWDHRLDLSLMEIDNGPFHHLPVAPPGHVPSRKVRSLGYDEMKWPVMNRPATILSTGPATTFTREKPWHGRSGGGLVDVEHRYLIGVVRGYEIGPAGRGIYVSHEAVLTFLRRHCPELIPIAGAGPSVAPCPGKL